MEDDPTFDAGRGSHLNAAGQVELDALIMDGATLNAGSVAAVPTRSAILISLARLVMEKSEHVMLVAKGAERFAREHGLPVCEPEDLLVGRELERWRVARGNPDRLISPAFGQFTVTPSARWRATRRGTSPPPRPRVGRPTSCRAAWAIALSSAAALMPIIAAEVSLPPATAKH